MNDIDRPTIRMLPIVMDSGVHQAEVLSTFYSRLLGWEHSFPAQNGTATVTSPEDRIMAFQETESYELPVWPWKPGAQGQILHFNLMVEDLEQAIRFSVDCGAKFGDEKSSTTPESCSTPGIPFAWISITPRAQAEDQDNFPVPPESVSSADKLLVREASGVSLRRIFNRKEESD